MYVPLLHYLPFAGLALIGGLITEVRNLEVEFPCQFRLERYPFGKYTCNLTFEHKSESINWIARSQMEGSYQDIEHQKEKDLLDFRLEKVRAQVHYLNKLLTLSLHLSAQPDYHLTNSFLPSALMFCLCYLSLFFPTACFNERVMVSLTSLLVVVTLFSQTTETIVRTPYYKLIDVWYLALIILGFAVVLVNATVNCLRVSKVKSKSYLMKKVLAAKRCNTACQVLLFICFVALIMIFALISREIM